MRKGYLWVVLLVVAALLVTSLPAMAQEKSPQPSDYWLVEFLSGERGAILGGLLGFRIAENYWDWDQIYRWLYGRENPCRGYFKRGFLFCPDDWGQLLPFHFGRALGASTGVVLAGLQVGVEGNILGAYLATGLWFIASSVSTGWIVPLVPAFVATIGYNIGAKMKADRIKSSSLEWRFPLFELRF